MKKPQRRRIKLQHAQTYGHAIGIATDPKYQLVAISKRAENRLKDCLPKLASYCRAPDPEARDATDLHEAMKQITFWPDALLLKQIEDSVMSLARNYDRKYPERRIWKNFERVNQRKKSLCLVEHISELVQRAKHRVNESNGSDKIQEKSEPLFSWLIRIGYPTAAHLKKINPLAALVADHKQEAERQRVRAGRAAKYQRSGLIIKKSAEDREDDRLMESVANGDDGALKMLYNRHAADVMNYVRRRMGGHKAVSVKAITLKIFNGIKKTAPTYVPTGAKFTTLLGEIAKNAVTDEKRRR